MLPGGVRVDRDAPTLPRDAQGNVLEDDEALMRAILSDPQARQAVEESMRMMESEEVQDEIQRGERYEEMSLQELTRETERRLGASEGSMSQLQDETRTLLEAHDAPGREAERAGAELSMEAVMAEMDALNADIEAAAEAAMQSGRDIPAEDQARFEARAADLEKRMTAALERMAQ